MCDSPACSDEHAPPESFFPASYQGNRLATVPSCRDHNHANSNDVEYVRNIFAIHYGTNAAAAEVAKVVERSWQHSEKLFNRTFREFAVAEVVSEDGTEETGVFRIDVPRVDRVITAVAHALFQLEKGRQWFGTFEVFCGFHSLQSAQGLADGTEPRGRWFASLDYVRRQTPFADVFEYRVHENDELVFAMNFYERLWIYARRIGRVLARPPHVIRA
jgi:hypothetical protein